MEKTITDMFYENFDPLLAQKEPVKIMKQYKLPEFDDYFLIENLCGSGGGYFARHLVLDLNEMGFDIDKVLSDGGQVLNIDQNNANFVKNMIINFNAKGTLSCVFTNKTPYDAQYMLQCTYASV